MDCETRERNSERGTLFSLISCAALVMTIFTFQGCLHNFFAFHPERVPADMPVPNKPGLSEFFIESGSGAKIHCFYFEQKGSRRVVLFLHGNAGNSYHRIEDAYSLSTTGTHVLLIDYQGYGKSEGRPSEKGIYQDASAAYAHLRTQMGFVPKEIFILGRSIGTAAALDVSQKKELGGIILVSPFTSGKDMARHLGLGWFVWALGSSAFNNLDKAVNVSSPVLIIHGKEDTLIPVSMGRRVYEALPIAQKEMIQVPGAGHNDVIQVSGPSFWRWVGEFMTRRPAANRQLTE